MVSENASCLYNAVILNKCISAHLWENSSYVTKQLPGIGIKNASCFTNAGIHSFSKLTDSHPRDVELVSDRLYYDNKDFIKTKLISSSGKPWP